MPSKALPRPLLDSPDRFKRGRVSITLPTMDAPSTQGAGDDPTQPTAASNTPDLPQLDWAAFENTFKMAITKRILETCGTDEDKMAAFWVRFDEGPSGEEMRAIRREMDVVRHAELTTKLLTVYVTTDVTPPTTPSVPK